MACPKPSPDLFKSVIKPIQVEDPKPVLLFERFLNREPVDVPDIPLSYAAH